jgi:hypothetical protein
MFNAPHPDIFSKLLPPALEPLPSEDKTMRLCPNQKHSRRLFRREPKLQDAVFIH